MQRREIGPDSGARGARHRIGLWPLGAVAAISVALFGTPSSAPAGAVRHLADLPGLPIPFGSARPLSGSAPASTSWVGMALTPNAKGYLLAASNGRVVAVGNARTFTSATTLPRHPKVVAIAATPDGAGYWLATASGQAAAFGDAVAYGAATGTDSADPAVAMVALPDGKGYFFLLKSGRVIARGAARVEPLSGGVAASASAVALVATSDGGGYWIVSGSGAVSAYGDARYYGSLPSRDYTAPIVGIAAADKSRGYLLAASNGGVFTFGSARFHGSAGGAALAEPITAIAALPTESGYYLLPTLPAGLSAPGPGFVAGHVTAIGDSVMLDAAPDLAADMPGIDIEAVVGRQWYLGVALAAQLKSEGRLGAIVIIDLGTNGPVDVPQFQSMMQVLSGASRVVFVTVHLPPSYSWSASVNATLAAEVPKYPNARLANFNALADAHPGWFGSDGVHMVIGGTGAAAMARLIAAVARG